MRIVTGNAYIIKINAVAIVTQKWETIETRGHKPSPRSGHTMTLNDSSETQMYLFGGACGQWGTFNDFYSFDISALKIYLSYLIN